MSKSGKVSAPKEVGSVDESLAFVLNTIMKKGEFVEDKVSIQGNFIEVRNLQFLINNPLKRISINPQRRTDLIAAIARFVWMISASDRLEDIAIYQDKVRNYSDNGLSIPGSSYGKRLFEPLPGFDQVEDVIKILKDNPASRRAYASIWSPTDANRISSKDLPCAVGLNFQIREKKLFTTLVMRSNNAITLLHMNLFEFTLLGEIVANELGIEYGGHIQYAMSMHIFKTDTRKAEAIAKSFKKIDSDEQFYKMRKMPREPSPMKEARKLAKLETILRSQNVFNDLSNLDIHLEKAKNVLHPYWYEFYKVLAIGVLVNISKFDKAFELAYSLPPYFRFSIISNLKFLEKNEKQKKNVSLDTYFEEEETGVNEPKSAFENIKKILAFSDEVKEKIISQVNPFCEEWNQIKKQKLDPNMIKQVIATTIANHASIAARSKGPKDVLKQYDDYMKISKKEVFDIIKNILEKNDQNSKLM